MPEEPGAPATRVLGHHVAAVLEQALAADLKEGGAADGKAPAEGVGGQPDRVVHGGSGGGLPGAAGEVTESAEARGAVGQQPPKDSRVAKSYYSTGIPLP